MVDLAQSLNSLDLGYLRIIAELWELDLDLPDAKTALRVLLPSLLNPNLVREILETLPPEAKIALDDLQRNNGCLPWPLFMRRYGILREMGPGRRDREQPHLHPTSVTESLWYHALITRAFLDTSAGPQEFAIIPTDLRELIPFSVSIHDAPFGRPASTKEHAHQIPANDHVLDQACSLLATLRLELGLDAYPAIPVTGWAAPETPPYPLPYTLSPYPLKILLYTACLLDDTGLPLPENTKYFLEAPRGEALRLLVTAWRQSNTFNELRLLPNLLFEGGWSNDPLRARQTILGWLSRIPADTWWSLDAFIDSIRENQPDFQRPAGDYDSWHIRHQEKDTYLRGFEYWDMVDGALIQFVIGGLLHWLGVIDLASPAEGRPAAAFRLSPWSASLLNDLPPQDLAVEDKKILVTSNALMKVPRLASRAVRYQVARFSNWEREKDDMYEYRITPQSLDRAAKQGLRINYLLTLLYKHAHSVPPAIGKALQRWEEHGSEARLEQAWVLRLRTPQLLQTLLKSRASRFLGNPLGPSSVIVKTGAVEKVLNILAEMGYLGEIISEEG